MPSVVRYDLQSDEALPPCEGPKLQPFKDRHERIEFLRLLSPLSTGGDTPGGHAHVFEVRINRALFALKIVGHTLLSTGLIR